MNKIIRFWKIYIKNRDLKHTLEFIGLHFIMFMIITIILISINWISIKNIDTIHETFIFTFFVLSLNHIILLLSDKEMYKEIYTKSY